MSGDIGIFGLWPEIIFQLQEFVMRKATAGVVALARMSLPSYILHVDCFVA